MSITKAEALFSLKPNAEWNMVGDTIYWLDSSETQPTDSEIETEVARLTNLLPMTLLRKERDIRLAKTDWRASSDLTLSTAWKTYRQNLRDLPATASPKLDANGNLDMSSVTFPTEPS
jgi:hypothetical protein|tara:strand:+ start:515 stop:868 length:354 start_codon:yes stop_codon:yes gene_type:complete